jgi:anti-sigma factor RsiW
VYADLLVDLSDGELFGDDRERVAAHVAECPACRGALARLDASLKVLKAGLAKESFAGRAVAASNHAAPAGARRLELISAVALAGLLAVGIVLWNLPRTSPTPPVARATNAAAPSTPAPAVISQTEALRRIALFEQQARLQTSLDLMPQAAWYDQQRADNQKLLDGFKAAAGLGSESMNTTPRGGEKL